MCGIVGFFTKNPEFESRLGEHLSSMLIEMSDRGPDSAGVAIYRDPAPKESVKLALFSADDAFPWKPLAKEMTKSLGHKADVEVRARATQSSWFTVISTALGPGSGSTTRSSGS